LLETYEILSVEQEVTVPLATTEGYEILLMGRPDGILRDKISGQYFTLSFKTTKKWDQRKDKSSKWDDQGISETIVADYWLQQLLNDPSLRIFGVQMVQDLKGEKREDTYNKPEGSDEKGDRKYGNSLIRPYFKQLMNEILFAMNWNWVGADGKKHSLAKPWTRVNIWETSWGVKGWVEALYRGEIELKDNEDGLKHPLDKFIVNPVYFRNDEDIAEWIAEVVYQEVRIRADRKILDEAVGKWGIQTRLFPKYRHSCVYPVNCEFQAVCHEGLDALGSGLFKPRVPNHPQEVV
jgi:hypothetical protein